eukprot:CAMPEP_0182496864 /NCGR_PEP_ID=MMETSP1321-20130603/5448_1 /TAXON_ID=91990 /ORGANISM="Bolidomonas sp., Strain RCC1657" /LENGTH=642 /DNA_ID=CAMNT_0024700585 /DNA_START=89 /DNA_END=2014 /DNA_ORIENTATION=+
MTSNGDEAGIDAQSNSDSVARITELRPMPMAYPAFYNTYASKRQPVLITAHGKSSDERIRYQMFSVKISSVEKVNAEGGGKEKVDVDTIMPFWWRDLDTLKGYAKLEGVKGLQAEEVESLSKVTYEVREGDGNFGYADRSKDVTASFSDFCENLTTNHYLSPQKPSPENLTLLRKHAGGKLASQYASPPFSLLAINQRKSHENKAHSKRLYFVPETIRYLHGLRLHAGNLWLGKTIDDDVGNSSGLHYDYHDNMLLCLKGYKRVRVIKPEFASKCYMVEADEGDFNFVEEEEEEEVKEEGGKGDDGDDDSEASVTIGKGFDYDSDTPDSDAAPKPSLKLPHFSRVDPNLSQKELSESFPDFVDVPQEIIDVGPGQMLYLPAGYLHEVRSYGFKPSDWKGGDEKLEDKEGGTIVEETKDDGVHMAANWWYDPPEKNATSQNPYNEVVNSLFTIKILIPSYVVGAIIGKGGTNIDEIKRTSGCNILEMSKIDRNNEFVGFFPNTSSRVCAIKGTLAQIKIAVQMIFEKLGNEKSYNTDKKTNRPLVPQNIKFQMAIMSMWAGPIIGEKGCLVNEVKKATTTHISIQKPSEVNLELTNGEVLLEVVADTRNNKYQQHPDKVKQIAKATAMVLNIIDDHLRDEKYK